MLVKQIMQKTLIGIGFTFIIVLFIGTLIGYTTRSGRSQGLRVLVAVRG